MAIHISGASYYYTKGEAVFSFCFFSSLLYGVGDIIYHYSVMFIRGECFFFFLAIVYSYRIVPAT